VPELRIHFEDEGVRVGILRNAVLTLWLKNPTAARVRAFRSAQRIVATGTGAFGGISVMAPLADEKLDLGEELRREFAESMKEFNGRPAAAAVLVEGVGFRAAAARALTTGIMLVARPKYPIKVFADRHEAARWLMPQLAQGVKEPLTDGEVLTALNTLERRGG
jgi:hypothetical protein